MCGRFLISALPGDGANIFNVPEEPSLFPEARFNIAPGQPVPVVVLAEGARQIRPMKWGLVPSWAKDSKVGFSAINARSETVVNKPTFRSAFKRRHCLIPASGFYEWRKVGKQKLQTLFGPTAGLFGFAGLWETWQGDGMTVESFTILTAAANATVAPTHDRMPVIIGPADYGTWPDAAKRGDAALFRPYSAEAMTATAVTGYVNDARHQGPQCVEPAAARWG